MADLEQSTESTEAGRPSFHLAYFDESGDSGIVNSPTKYFVLSCVLVPLEHWSTNLDKLVKMRSILRDKFGIRARPEIKSTDLRKGRGPLQGLGTSLDERMSLFGKLLRYQAKRMIGLHCFAIAIQKSSADAKGSEPRLTAWRYALQRVNKFCGADGYSMIFPDEGHGYFIRRLLRRMRRHEKIPGYYGGGLIDFPTTRIIEDPNDRKSHDSYFIQLADWNAFAAHRSKYVDPLPAVPDTLWDELKEARLLDVNKVTGGPPGIVVWPR